MGEYGRWGLVIRWGGRGAGGGGGARVYEGLRGMGGGWEGVGGGGGRYYVMYTI